MTKVWWIWAGLGLLLAVGCDKVENVTTTTTTTAAATDVAHNQGKSCTDCHTNWNLVQMHDSSSSQYNGDCILCHGDRTKDTTLSSSVTAIHPKMCPYVYQAAGQTTMNNAVCVYCHQNTEFMGDVTSGSGANLRKQVNVSTKCVMCHTVAGPGKELYKN